MRGRAPSRPARRRLGRAEAACACVCVWPGIREGPLLPPARPERRDGRLAGAQALLQKHTSPRVLEKRVVDLPCVQSRKTCSTSAFSLKQKYHPEHPSLWYFGMSSLGWKVEVKTQSDLPPPQNWTLKTTKKSPNNQKSKIGGEAVKCKFFFTPIACHPSLQKGLWMCSMCRCSTAISVQDSMHVCRAIILSKTFL